MTESNPINIYPVLPNQQIARDRQNAPTQDVNAFRLKKIDDYTKIHFGREK